MPQLVSTGQITIVDTNDARPLTAYLTANPGTQQIYSKDNDTVSYTPSWFTANSNTGLQITAKVFVGGIGGSVDVTTQLTNRKFTFSQGGAAITNATTSSDYVNDTDGALTTPFTVVHDGTQSYIRIKGNLKDTVGQEQIIFEGDYTDPNTGLVSSVISSISLSSVRTGTNAVYINIRGNTIIEEATGSTKNVVAITADLVRSSGVDTSNLTYKWYEANGATQITTSTPSVATKYGFKTTAAGSSPTGSTSDLNVNIPAAAGNTFNTIVVSENAITDLGVYKVTITDSSDGRTWEGWFTIFDVTDPYDLRILSSSGDKLQNGIGSTTLTPIVYYGTTQVTNLTGWTFDWYFYDKNGKRGAFVDTAKISTAGGAPITANTTGTSATITYTGTSYAFTAGMIVKAVKPNGDAFYYEVASSTTNVVTIRTPSTNTWLSFANFAAPSSTTDFVGGKLYGCLDKRTSSAGAGVTVTGDEIDVKGVIVAEANRP